MIIYREWLSYPERRCPDKWGFTVHMYSQFVNGALIQPHEILLNYTCTMHTGNINLYKYNVWQSIQDLWIVKYLEPWFIGPHKNKPLYSFKRKNNFYYHSIFNLSLNNLLVGDKLIQNSWYTHLTLPKWKILLRNQVVNSDTIRF